MLAALRGRRRHRQRRLPSGRLHLAQSQGPSLAPRPCVQRPRHHRQPRLGARAGDGGADRARVLVARRARVGGRARARRPRRAGAEPLAPDDRHDQRRRAAKARAKRGGSRRAQPRLPRASRRCGCASAFSSSTPSSSAAIQAFAPEAARQLHDVPDALGGAVPDLLHGRERRRHGHRRLPRRRPVALREDRRHRLRHRRRVRADDRLRAARADGGAGAVRA